MADFSATMKADYDPKADVLTIVFSDAPAEESDEVMPGVSPPSSMAG
jgi:hypothetical protein